MPDFTYEYKYSCDSNLRWETSIASSSEPGRIYRIRFEPLTRWEAEAQGLEPGENGYTCECAGYQHRHKCRHVADAKLKHCRWDGFTSGEEPITVWGDPQKYCPKCGNTCTILEHAV